ncbi:unnamed protein product [Parnassius apollo]|uniref:(apollo) hypothetical protein n=1 Tax=Parnassius apollo TaxID=110799 RepID=A0A8S3WRW3_PARAO|nr:unnamed protein product [Parnassius apollo]
MDKVRRLGLGSGPRRTFDLNDPYCYNVSYDYVPMHDPHLAHHFSQKPAQRRMKQLGFCTKDGRAVCSLKEFNQYRKYLYNQFMDRIHMEMKKLDERARDDLTLRRVEADVSRRLQAFIKTERAREHLERVAQEHADEWAEKKRLAKEQERNIQARMRYLAEFNERKRRERAARAREKENRIKQRVQAAAEMELRRKITMIRQWRTNEKKRINRLKQEREAKQKLLEEEANNKWTARIDAQNMKIQEEALLLKLYTDDMKAGAMRRAKKAEIYAYNTDLELQRLRLANWKLLHGGNVKAAKLVRKMGMEFEKSKRGAKGMCSELAQHLAQEAMRSAVSTQGDPFVTLSQARTRMDRATVLPSAPLKLLDELLESAVMEFARLRVHFLLRDVENVVRSRAAHVFFLNFHPTTKKRETKRRSKARKPRWSIQIASELARHYANEHNTSIGFGEIITIPPDTETDVDLKSVKNRPPTPVPSKTKLAEVTFIDRVEDLPDAVSVPSYLPERRKLLEMVNTAAKLLSRSVNQKVQKGMDITLGIVTLPRLRQSMNWGDAVEGLAGAVVDNRVHADAAEVRHASEFLAYRILRSLQAEMKRQKQKKISLTPSEEDQSEFYVPERVAAD